LPTVSKVALEAVAGKFASPLYVATMVWLPSASWVTDGQDAPTVVTGERETTTSGRLLHKVLAGVVDLSVNVIVPVGKVAPLVPVLMVAEKDTGWLTTREVEEAIMLTDVPGEVTL
jgi:hypothetical protein